MKFLIVWEEYDQNWKLIGKGSHFLFTEDSDDIDIDAIDFVTRVTEAKKIKPEQAIIVSCNRVV